MAAKRRLGAGAMAVAAVMASACGTGSSADDGTAATSIETSTTEVAAVGSPTAPTPSSTTEAPSTTTTAVEESVADPVTLLDPGAEPRVELRLSIPELQAETMIATRRRRPGRTSPASRRRPEGHSPSRPSWR